jgi:octaprenyl-diphosphate synthase
MNELSLIKRPVSDEYDCFRDDFLNSLSSPTLRLQSAINKIMQSVGKHVRPLLVLLSAKICGSITKNTINSAVLLELLHTASLIHDDVIDHTKERRGIPSLNAFFDNRISVLVGDYMLSSALIRSINTGNMRIMNIVSNVGRALAEGEIRQLEMAEEIVLDEESYFDVIKNKTAFLLSASAEIGAISSERATENLVSSLKKIGEYLGICFQIRDDIFDYYDTCDIGKPTGNDILEGKVTLPLLYALNNSADLKRKYYKDIVREKKYTPEHVSELIEFAKLNGGIEYAENYMKLYHSKAIQILNQLPDSEALQSLQMLSNFIIERKR